MTDKLSYKRIEGDVAWNPYIQKGQTVILDERTMQICVIYTRISADYAERRLGVRLEEMEEEEIEK